MNKKINVALIIIFSLIPNVLGNKLTLNSEGLGNHTLLFVNDRTYSEYLTTTDDNGNFFLNEKLFMDNISKNDLITVYIGKKLIISGIAGTCGVIENASVIGYFKAIKNIAKLNINVFSPNQPFYSDVFNGECGDETKLDFCSVAIAKDKIGLVYYDEKLFNETVKHYKFKSIDLHDLLDEEGKAFFIMSQFASDGYNPILQLSQWRGQLINITNPHDILANATIRTPESDCIFKNGKNEIIETFNPNETKLVEVISERSTECHINIEWNLIKTGDIDINISEKLVIDLSIFGGLGFSFYWFFLKRKKK